MRILTFLLLLLTGLGMALPGLYLASLGGSLYYVIAGGLIVVSAVLVLRGSRAGVTLFWLVFLGTVIWSIWEVGFDGWALMPRLVYLAVAALWLLLLPAARGSRRIAATIAVVLLGGGALAAALPSLNHGALAQVPAAPMPAPLSAQPGEWTHYGASLHGTRYSDLAQITPANAGNLEQAWIYHSGLHPKDAPKKTIGLEVTPLMVDGTIYGCNGNSAVFALDPVTGKQIWRHDTVIDKARAGFGVCRGVSFFRAPAGTAECPTRLLLGTIDNHLIALDARTGESCKSFGTNGSVDLAEGEGNYPGGWTNPTSPPAIVHGTAVIGAFIIDNADADMVPGVVRGFDAVTGKLKWAFDPGRPNDHGPLAPGQTYTPSTPNAWTLFSGDEQLGLVYIPTGNGSPDYWGVKRTADTDRFSSAVVALDADTGDVRWVFQAIHHDLWDYDLGAQPALVDYPTANGPVPALIQPTKTGQIFVLDRRTGKPLRQVTEKPVPASTIPDERWSKTQPFSTAMPDFAGPRLTEADMWGITPFDQLYCRIKFRQARYEGIFTPLQFGPSIRTPGELGGIDWGSVSVDEGRGIVVVNSNLMADTDEMISRAQADSEHLFTKRDPRARGATPPPIHGAAMAGTPYGIHFNPLLTPGLNIPCQRPPWGYLAAVELKSGKLLWKHTLGDASNSGPFHIPLGLPLPIGVPNIGGSVVTRGGVIFIAATQDQHFRAVDEATGAVLWDIKLPAGGHATPMTYLGKDGKQYVLIAAGGQKAFQTAQGDDIIAYRLK